MFRICLLYSLFIFVGCASTTPIGNSAKVQSKPTVIRIFPGIRMPVNEQIKLFQKIQKMPPEEVKKLELMLDAGLLKSDKEIIRQGLYYPRNYKQNIKGK